MHQATLAICAHTTVSGHLYYTLARCLVAGSLHLFHIASLVFLAARALHFALPPPVGLPIASSPLPLLFVAQSIPSGDLQMVLNHWFDSFLDFFSIL